MTIEAISSRVHEALENVGTDYSMEEIVRLCSDLTWNQVFLAVDYLSRSGQVRLTVDADRTYRTQASHAPIGQGSLVGMTGP